MTAVRSFVLAIELATDKRDKASQCLVQAQRAHLFAQDQMAQLQSYAQETETRWSIAAQASTTPELMRHHYQFMERLHHAIGLQTGVIASTSQTMEAHKRLVLEAEFRLRGLKQVLKKKQAGLALLQGRREQKQMDEFAALRSRSSTLEITSGTQS